MRPARRRRRRRTAPPGPSPEHRVIPHRGDPHPGPQIAAAVPGPPDPVQNHPRHQQHNHQCHDAADQCADGRSHIAVRLGIVPASGRIGFPDGGDIIFLQRHAVIVREPIHVGVHRPLHARIVIPGGEIILHVRIQDIQQFSILTLQAVALRHAVIAQQTVLGIVLDRQHQYQTVIALCGAYAVLISQVPGIFHNICAAGGIHRHHHNLRTGLGKERGVHGVNMPHGIVCQHPRVVIDVGIGSHNGGGCLAGRLLRLADENACCDSQKQHHRSH